MRKAEGQGAPIVQEGQRVRTWAAPGGVKSSQGPSSSPAEPGESKWPSLESLHVPLSSSEAGRGCPGGTLGTWQTN